MNDFETRLAALDGSLFEKIPSQTTPDDKRSLLAIEAAVRSLRPDYVYFEIGSHLGGSIQPHLVDPLCSRIFSLDKRPMAQPDERGVSFGYPENSTARMLGLLSEIGPTEKLTTIDGETRSVDKQLISATPQLCFIDGEHTDAATIADFEFCLDILDRSGAIIFHDSHVIYGAISQCLEKLTAEGIEFHAYNLPTAIFVIEVSDFPMHETQHIRDLLVENHKGYLLSLKLNDEYRRFTTSSPMKYVWKLFIKLGIKF